MRSAGKRWFTEEARRTGWISVGVCLIVAYACSWMARNVSGLQPVALIYALFPIGLGWAAVGALNFYRWHSFRESMEACAAAVVNTYKLLGGMALIALCFSILLGPVFLYLLMWLIYGSLFLAFWLSVMFLAAVLLACAAGAVLYGLLLVMRSVGEMGQRNSDRKAEAPKVLRVVV